MREKSEKFNLADIVNEVECGSTLDDVLDRMSGQECADGSVPSERLRYVCFKAEFVRIAERMCALGATNYDLAYAFNTSLETVLKWKREHKQFAKACERGIARATGKVARSLYQEACGYDYVAQAIFHFNGRTIVGQYLKHVPANVKAAMFWLVNRLPEEWSYDP